MLLRGQGLVPWPTKGGGENRSMITAIQSGENMCFKKVFLISDIISFAYYMSPILIVLFSFSIRPIFLIFFR